jgi:hypothetical protein
MKSVIIRLLVIYAVALGINYLWEMAQMPLYQEMRFDDIRAYLICLRASFGDANITIIIFVIGLLFFKSWYWPKKLTILKVAYLVFSGGGTAIVIELIALNRGSWTYTPLMPLIPVLRTGLVPFVQLMILPYFSYLISIRTPTCSKPRKSN